MTQSPLEGVGDLLPEMPLPPQPPLEDEADPNLVHTFDYDGLKYFTTWQDAINWSIEQRVAGSPKYLVRKSAGPSPDHNWEAIQEWLRMF